MFCATSIPNVTPTMTECRQETIAALSHTDGDQHINTTECALIASTDNPHSLAAPTELPLSAAFCTPLGVLAHSVAVVTHLHHPFLPCTQNLKPRPAPSQPLLQKGLHAHEHPRATW